MMFIFTTMHVHYIQMCKNRWHLGNCWLVWRIQERLSKWKTYLFGIQGKRQSNGWLSFVIIFFCLHFRTVLWTYLGSLIFIKKILFHKFEKIKIDRRALEFSKYYFIKDQRKDDCPCVIIWCDPWLTYKIRKCTVTSSLLVMPQNFRCMFSELLMRMGMVQLTSENFYAR